MAALTPTVRALMPLIASETLLRGFDGQPPYKGCAISAAIACTAGASGNEAVTGRDGRLFDRAECTELLKTGWRAFERVADSNGIPDIDDYLRIHRAMFPGYPDPERFTTRSLRDVLRWLDAGEMLSVSVFLGALPVSSEWRDYTNVAHQVAIRGRRGGDPGETQRQDPMRRWDPTYDGEWRSLAQMEVAAKSFPAPDRGKILGWRYPILGWTREKLATRGLKVEIRELRTQVENKEDRLAALREELERCQAGGHPDCGPLEEAARVAAHRASIAWHESQVGG